MNEPVQVVVLTSKMRCDILSLCLDSERNQVLLLKFSELGQCMSNTFPAGVGRNTEQREADSRTSTMC